MSCDNYEIVIIKDKKFDKSNCAVIVPRTYVRTNAQLNSFVRYLAPPYEQDDIEFLNDFIQKQATPPDSWGSFKCIKKDCAG